MSLVGDIIAIEGSSWLSQDIIKKTRRAGDEQASHVGLVTATVPFIQVTEALWHITTRPLTVTIGSAKRAYCLSLRALTAEQRSAIATRALSYEGRNYGYTDILWQAMDSLTNSRWWTGHLAERHWPICSMLDDLCYESVGVRITPAIPDLSITPNDVLANALANPEQWTVTQIK